MSTNAPLLDPAVNSSTVSTDITPPNGVSTAAKRKYDELIATFPATDTSNKKARPKPQQSPSLTRLPGSCDDMFPRLDPAVTGNSTIKSFSSRMVFDDVAPSLDEDEVTPVPSATNNILAQRAARQAAAVPPIAPVT
ncbi:hypothetical protein K438DRAFT_1753462 [Mycena galopus ATCC 62051]|nr:hypothetical protein K438DRAFT_1753462 [Mycena galopus ATCC 62051]